MRVREHSQAVISAALLLLLAASANPAVAASVEHTRVVGADPADWTPHALDGVVETILQIGDRVYMGGSFTKVRDADSRTEIDLGRLVAFDATTGQIDTRFRPRVNSVVRALEASADGRSIYVGGYFSSAGGEQARRLAKLDARTGDPVRGFRPPALDGAVLETRLVGDRLLIGGTFGRVGQADRRALAAVDADTGAADAWLDLGFDGQRVTSTGAWSPVKVEAMEVSPDGSRLVAVGNFMEVAGRPRHQIAMVDLTTSPASLSPWSTTRFEPECSENWPTYMRGIDFSPDGTWFAVATGGRSFPGRLCDAVSRWEVSREVDDKQPTWINYTGGDSLLSVAITGAAVYAGGHQRWMDATDRMGQYGGVTREGIGAIDPDTGRVLPWNPGKERGIGTGEIYVTPDGVWIGSDTRFVADERHERIAFFPLGRE